MNKRNILLALKISLIVGSALNLINNYEILFWLEFDLKASLKVGFTYLVPFFVSLYSSYKTMKK